jgi:peptidoglycan/xylan/chitin deacetylase (PgdA/CDA1 family)
MRKIFLCFFISILIATPCIASEELDTEVFFFREKEVELPVVMYHLVTERPRLLGKYGITPAELEADLQFLYENDYNTVVMQDLIDFVTRGKRLPKNPVMLTFDDGNSSDYHYVLPLLEKYEMTAVFAVLGETADRFSAEAEKNPAGKYPHLTWAQIIEMHESGYAEIQSHSYNYHKPPTGSGKRSGETIEAYHERLYTDLRKFQAACLAYLDYAPTTYVYPLGVIGENSRAVLEELGMAGSISCQEGMNTIRQGDKDCLFRLRRTNRPHGRGIKEILKSIS